MNQVFGISRDDFKDYEDILTSGVTNMCDTRMVCDLTGLDRETVSAIRRNYTELKAACIPEAQS